jgi:hypothetical protein
MRAAVCFLVLVCPALASGADPPAIATAKQDTRSLTFWGGLGTKVEGLMIALLGSCSVVFDESDGAKQAWAEAEKADHVRVRFAKPRRFQVNDDQKEIEVAEIIVTMSATKIPDRFVVRNGNQFRSLAKYDPGMVQRRVTLLSDAKAQGIVLYGDTSRLFQKVLPWPLRQLNHARPAPRLPDAEAHPRRTPDEVTAPSEGATNGQPIPRSPGRVRR